MAIAKRLLEESSYSRSTDGEQIVEVYHITEIGGNPEARFIEAVNHPDLPKYGAPHPSRSNLKALDIQVRPVARSPQQAKVIVTFRPPVAADSTAGDVGGGGGNESSGQIIVGATVQDTTTQLDKNGNQLKVSIRVIESDAQGNESEVIKEQFGEVNIQVPQIVIRVSRRERNSPRQKAQTYVGKVNSNFQWGDPPRVWLCTRIEGSSDDGGDTWNVDYEFQRNEATWDATIVYIDPETDKPHEQVTLPGLGRTANGVLIAQVYSSIDFSPMSLPA